MNHQPFEEWLLSEGSLAPEQDRALQEHLRECEACLSLSRAWDAVEDELAVAPQAVPVAGFSQRWQGHLEQRRAQDQRHRFWQAGGAGLAALVGIVLLAGPIYQRFSPTEFLASFIYNLSLLFVKVNQVGVFLSTTFSGISVIIPITIWVLIATSLSLLGMTWMVTMWKIIIPKGAITL
jgi:hypothetical protein